MSNEDKKSLNSPEKVYVDKNGQAFDAKGNKINYGDEDGGAENWAKPGSKKILTYSSKGQPLYYSYVFPGPVNVHVNKSLSDFSVSYELDSGQFIAPVVSPIKTVEHQSDKYFQLNRADVIRDYGNKLNLAIGATATEMAQSFQTNTYNAELYGIRDFLPDRLVNNADEALEIQYNTTKLLTSIIDLAWDRRVINGYFNATSGAFSSATMTAAGGGTIPNATTTNRYIQKAINYARSQVILNNNGLAPTHIVMSVNTALAIAASPEIAGQVVYSNAGPTYVKMGGFEGPNYGLPDQLYGLKVVVAPTPSDSSAINLADNISYLMDNTITVLRVDAPGRRTHNAITSFRVGGLVVKSYRDEAKEGFYVEVRQNQTEELTNQYGGFSLTATGA